MTDIEPGPYMLVELMGGPWDGERGAYHGTIRSVAVPDRSAYASFESGYYMPDVHAGEYRKGTLAFYAVVSAEILARPDRPMLWEILERMVPMTPFHWHPADGGTGERRREQENQ